MTIKQYTAWLRQEIKDGKTVLMSIKMQMRQEGSMDKAGLLMNTELFIDSRERKLMDLRRLKTPL